MPVYPGVPAPEFFPLLDHESSRERYHNAAEFYLGLTHIPGNTGTYIDSPFHRYPSGEDLSRLPLESIVGLPGVVIDPPAEQREIVVAGQRDLTGRAILFRTGWDRRWGTDAYWEPAPYLGERAIDTLIEVEAALVGVDFWNVDDTDDPARPAHTRLLAAGIPIVEHLCNLEGLPTNGFRFSAPVLAIEGGASFPVRAFAEID